MYTSDFALEALLRPVEARPTHTLYACHTSVEALKETISLEYQRPDSGQLVGEVGEGQGD